MLANPFGVGFPRDDNVIPYSDVALPELIAFTSGKVWHGLRRWWKCEMINLGLMFVSPTPEPATRSSAAAPAEA